MHRLAFPSLLTMSLLSLPLAGTAAADLGEDDVDRARTGATFGIGLGGGHMGCAVDGEDCGDDATRPAGGLGLRAGWMLSPSLALTGDLWAMTHRDDRLTVTQGILAAKVRAWVLPRLWVEGGAGVARASAEVDLGIGDVMAESETVPAVAGGVGVEVVRTPELGLDVELEAGTGFYEDELQVYQVSLGAAVSFY